MMHDENVHIEPSTQFEMHDANWKRKVQMYISMYGEKREGQRYKNDLIQTKHCWIQFFVFSTLFLTNFHSVLIFKNCAQGT